MSEELFEKVERAFDRDALKRVCEMHETEFAREYSMETVKVDQRGDEDFYLFKDNGADVLAVAHLDTVGPHAQRTARFLDTEAGPVVYSRALDDRLGAYIILDLLPRLGIRFDWLLTVGEESGMSTADFFEAEKEYNWMIEFDRGGTDVVMYQYEDSETVQLVKDCGAKVGDGIFSDISYMESLGIKGFNWGVGYRDYHGPRAHAYLDDTVQMVAHFLDFHADNAERPLPHVEVPQRIWWDSKYEKWDEYDNWDSNKECEVCKEKGGVDPLNEQCVMCDTCLVCYTSLRFCECPWNKA